MASAFVKALSEILVEGGADVRMHSCVMLHTGHLLMSRDEKISAEGAQASDMLREACGGVK
jgi:hypothetical protein